MKPRMTMESVTNQRSCPPKVGLSQVQLRKILVPVDFSDLSYKALQYAAAFAQEFGTHIFLLHVMEPPSVMPTEFGMPAASAYDMRPIEKSASQRLQLWRRRIVQPISAGTAVRIGNASQEIIVAAKENDIDLIVMGTHGRSGLSHLLLGSTAERIVRQASCPVLVIREKEREFVRGDKGCRPRRRAGRVKQNRISQRYEK